MPSIEQPAAATAMAPAAIIPFTFIRHLPWCFRPGDDSPVVDVDEWRATGCLHPRRHPFRQCGTAATGEWKDVLGGDPQVFHQDPLQGLAGPEIARLDRLGGDAQRLRRLGDRQSLRCREARRPAGTPRRADRSPFPEGGAYRCASSLRPLDRRPPPARLPPDPALPDRGGIRSPVGAPCGEHATGIRSRRFWPASRRFGPDPPACRA